MLAERGIEAEYGGHVLQLLLPRDRFAAHPEYFPCARGRAADGKRQPVRVESGGAGVGTRGGARLRARQSRDGAAAHLGRGRTARCVVPMRRVRSAYAATPIYEGGQRNCGGAAPEGDAAPPVAYLAYHDTLDPDRALRPLDNVWFEWAPRERCYSHAIDDPACTVNPRYLESLKRYIDLFDGRGGIFEYYADAILFGGMGFATPSIIIATSSPTIGWACGASRASLSGPSARSPTRLTWRLSRARRAHSTSIPMRIPTRPWMTSRRSGIRDAARRWLGRTVRSREPPRWCLLMATCCVRRRSRPARHEDARGCWRRRRRCAKGWPWPQR